jgi:hypothetical protein
MCCIVEGNVTFIIHIATYIKGDIEDNTINNTNRSNTLHNLIIVKLLPSFSSYRLYYSKLW